MGRSAYFGRPPSYRRGVNGWSGPRRAAPPELVATLPASRADSAVPAGEEADQPDQRDDRSRDEEPLEQEAAGHECQHDDRENNQQQHGECLPFGGSCCSTGERSSRGSGYAARPVASDAPGFSHEDVERAARYHRPLYLALALGLGLAVATYAALEWSAPGRWLWARVAGLGWAGSAAAWAAIVVVVAELVRLPLAWWRGLLRERRWGFSKQTAGGWLADRAKGLGIGV